MTIATITAAFTRHYTDSSQLTAYICWIDSAGKVGRTEGERTNSHMRALFDRARREGVSIEHETW